MAIRRRTFLKSGVAAATMSLSASRVLGANDEIRIGTIVQCEDGYVRDGAAYDNQGRQIRQFTRTRVSTKENFIDAVRAHDPRMLYTDALEGHLSAGLVHMAHISQRLGRATPNGEIRDSIQSIHHLSESFARLEEHLGRNRIDTNKEPLMLGPMLEMDRESERFVGPFSKAANRHVSRAYREPFVVPEVV